MTEQTPEPEPNVWDEEPDGPGPFGGPSYPEYPYSLADHVYTWSPKLPDGSMLVIRANTAEALAEASEALGAVAGRLRAAWQNVTGVPQAAPQGAPMPPQGQFPPQGGVNYNPQMPPPNQPYPGQPAWQQGGAPAPQAPQQQWGGAPQGANVPQGWYKLNVPFKPQGGNPGKPGFDAIVTQYGFKKADPSNGGQVSFQKAVKSWYCAPEVVQAFAQFNPMAA